MKDFNFFILMILFTIFGFMTHMLFYAPVIPEDIIFENITEIQEIQNIANEVSNTFVFSRPNFMCGQFARALQNRLEQKNYTAIYCEGVIENSTIGHAWIEVITLNETIPIESITGEFIEAEKYKEEYLNKTCEEK